jgi:hypothetical protein
VFGLLLLLPALWALAFLVAVLIEAWRRGML